MIKINVIVRNVSWKKYIKNPNSYINKKISLLNKKNRSFKKNILNCSLLLSESKEIKKLNKKFRNKNKITDVLSFPFYEKKVLNILIKKQKETYLGDIVINLSKIKKNVNKSSFEDEFNKLWIHGLVHLFGHKHKQDKDYYIMNKIEKKYLEYIN